MVTTQVNLKVLQSIVLQLVQVLAMQLVLSSVDLVHIIKHYHTLNMHLLTLVSLHITITGSMVVLQHKVPRHQQIADLLPLIQLLRLLHLLDTTLVPILLKYQRSILRPIILRKPIHLKLKRQQ